MPNITIFDISYRTANTKHFRPDVSAVSAGDSVDEVGQPEPDGRPEDDSCTDASDSLFKSLNLCADCKDKRIYSTKLTVDV